MKNTDLITKMGKAMNYSSAYLEDFEQDSMWLADEKLGYNDYLWVVKKAGTELIPLTLALAKGCFSNDKAHLVAEREVKAYLVKVTSRKDGTFDGAMTGVRDLKRYLTDNEKTPFSVSMKFLLYNGKSEEVSTKWHPDYHDILLNKIDAAQEDIEWAYVTEVIY